MSLDPVTWERPERTAFLTRDEWMARPGSVLTDLVALGRLPDDVLPSDFVTMHEGDIQRRLVFTWPAATRYRQPDEWDGEFQGPWLPVEGS